MTEELKVLPQMPFRRRKESRMTVIRSQCKDNDEYKQALRDDFAAAALQGVMAHGHTAPFSAIAVEVYQLADAMLAARGKQP